MEVTTVLIFSEHLVFLEGLAEVLRREPRIAVIGQTSSMEEAVSTAQRERPDVVLLDIAATDAATLDGIRRMKRDHAEVRIFVLCISGRLHSVSSCLRAGASGYLPADIGPLELFQLVRGIRSPSLRFQAFESRSRMSQGTCQVREIRSKVIRFPLHRDL